MGTGTRDMKLGIKPELIKRFEECPLKGEELLYNLGLFMNVGTVNRILYLNELYQEILDIPGVLMEIGCWRGRNLVIMEHLRAIYEPFNDNRRIIGFDTFAGYPKNEDSWKCEEGYDKYLYELLKFHERNNAGNERNHQVLKGDASIWLQYYLEKNPGTLVALAYFDLTLYRPTAICLKHLLAYKCLIPGSIIVLDELEDDTLRDDALAFQTLRTQLNCEVKKSRLWKNRSYIRVK